ncbi:MAG TPA: 16S rRNA (cytosine(967)-C(5))-methyltransferase RsmB [Firmicutes bacterium]|nr:16S rRNA (cytosine(967)-C(5))-methyltransferase RsmB [Bacillota bacterium]
MALDVLVTVEERAAYANLALGHALERAVLSPAERGLATELVYGVCRRRLTLDWVLGQLTREPVERMQAWVRNLLRLSLYQLLYLSRIRPEAACDEAVEIAKRRGHRGIAGLVNAVLRAYLRRQAEVTWPDPERERVRWLAVRESHPAWLVERWVVRLGPDEAAALLAADNLPPPVSLRVNRRRTSREEVLAALAARGIRAEASHWAPEGVVLRSAGGAVERLPEVAEGLTQVQDEASMLIAHLVGPRPGERILDAASAPGGKTTHLAELMGDHGEVRALDVHPAKLGLVEANAARLGLSCIRTQVANALELEGTEGFRAAFDRVLLDAPCTGLGVLRRRPDARWRKAPEDVEALGEQQRRMLASVAAAVRPGGRLVYSTCSTEAEEGEQVVEDFLARQGGRFRLLPAREVLKAAGVPAAEEGSAFPGPYLRLWPHRHGTDGFFAACLERLEDDNAR